MSEREYTPKAKPPNLSKGFDSFVMLVVGALPMIGGGAYFSLLFWMDYGDSSSDGIEEIIASFSLVTIIVGFHFTAYCFKCLHRAWVKSDMSLTHKNCPWVWDYPWNSEGNFNLSGKSLRFEVTCIALLLCYAIPLLAQSHVPILLLCVLMFILLCHVYRISLIVKANKRRFIFKTFPYRLGESGVVVLEGVPENIPKEQWSVNVRMARSITAVRSYKTVEYDSAMDMNRRQRKTYTFLRFFEQFAIELPQSALQLSGSTLTMNMDFPSNPELTTRFGKAEDRFWEVHITAGEGEQGIDMGCVIPVYKHYDIDADTDRNSIPAHHFLNRNN